jgi:hypothetical protein
LLDPIKLFLNGEFGNGKRLCLLPIGRIHAEEPTYISPTIIYYPPDTLKRSDLSVVSTPDEEFREISRKCKVPGTDDIQVDGSDLPWFQSGATRITAEDFFACGLLAFSIDFDWNDLIAPSSQQQHRDIISLAAAQAERTLDVLRLNYCRIDLPDTLPQFAGLLGKTEYSAALFYTADDNESYIIAHQLMTHQIVAGLGLEIDNQSTVQDVGNGPVGNIAKHGLMLRSAALSANNVTAKFIDMMGLLEYLAEPYEYIGMQDVKKQIGRHVAHDRAAYQAVSDDFYLLTAKKDDQGQYVGLRHNIIHVGSRLEDLLPTSEVQETLVRLDRYVCSVLFDFIGLAQDDWSSVVELRARKLAGFGMAS